MPTGNNISITAGLAFHFQLSSYLIIPPDVGLLVSISLVKPDRVVNFSGTFIVNLRCEVFRSNSPRLHAMLHAHFTRQRIDHFVFMKFLNPASKS